MGWWQLLMIPMWHLMGSCSKGERKQQGARWPSTELSTSLMTSTMVSRGSLTNGLQGRGPRPEEARGDCIAHPERTHTGREADREQSGVHCLDSFPITYISCPITRPAAHTCWTRHIVLKQVLFTATAAQLCFCLVSVGKSWQKLHENEVQFLVHLWPCPMWGSTQRPLKRWPSWVSSPFYGDDLRLLLSSSYMKNLQVGSGCGTRMDSSWPGRQRVRREWFGQTWL